MALSYTRTTWSDAATSGTPITAARMNNIESQLVSLTTATNNQLYNSGGTITGDLAVGGNLTINDLTGNGTTYNVANEIKSLKDSVSYKHTDSNWYSSSNIKGGTGQGIVITASPDKTEFQITGIIYLESPSDAWNSAVRIPGQQLNDEWALKLPCKVAVPQKAYKASYGGFVIDSDSSSLVYSGYFNAFSLAVGTDGHVYICIGNNKYVNTQVAYVFTGKLVNCKFQEQFAYIH